MNEIYGVCSGYDKIEKNGWVQNSDLNYDNGKVKRDAHRLIANFIFKKNDILRLVIRRLLP